MMNVRHHPSRFAALALLAGAVLAGPLYAQAQDSNGVCRVAPLQADSPSINTVAPYGSTASGAGASWSQPTTLRAALAQETCKIILLRQGVYKPTTTPDRDATFSVSRPVQLKGGYTGGAGDERSLNATNTVLSGDIDGDDELDGTTGITTKVNSNNSYHVVSMGGSDINAGNGIYRHDPQDSGTYTLLEGLSITGGKADFFTTNSNGAGLMCNGNGGKECSPHISHVVFATNVAYGEGGAISHSAQSGKSSSLIEYTTFMGNAALQGSGGAISNTAYNGESSPTLRNSTFVRNSGSFGGAIGNNCTTQGQCNPSIINSTFDSNSALYGGGAIANQSRNGGSQSRTTIISSTFSGNRAQIQGGAIYNSAIQGSSTPGVSTLQAVASIFWGNTASDGSQLFNSDQSSTMDIQRSIVQNGNGWSSSAPGAGNLLGAPANPLLQPLSGNGGTTKTMLPGPGSSAIDAVACDGIVNEDQRGAARPSGARCDIGAVEVTQFALSVSISGAGTVRPNALPIGAAAWPVCGTDDCSALAYPEHSTVMLTASPGPGMVFSRWGGDACAQSSNPTCSVTLQTAQSVTATFVPVYALDFVPPSNGAFVCTSGNTKVVDTSAPPGCKAGLAKCQGWGDENILPEGSAVQCVATPAANYLLSHWDGACASAGSATTCQLTMDSAKTVGATFSEIPPPPPGRTSVALNSSGNPSKAGDAVTFTVQVSAVASTTAKAAPVLVPTGPVELHEGTTLLGSAELVNGSASFTVQTLPAGSHTLIASYAGNAQWEASTMQIVQTVEKVKKPEEPVATVTPVPALGPWMLSLLSLLAGVLGWGALGRKTPRA